MKYSIFWEVFLIILKFFHTATCRSTLFLWLYSNPADSYYGLDVKCLPTSLCLNTWSRACSYSGRLWRLLDTGTRLAGVGPGLKGENQTQFLPEHSAFQVAGKIWTRSLPLLLPSTQPHVAYQETGRMFLPLNCCCEEPCPQKWLK